MALNKRFFDIILTGQLRKSPYFCTSCWIDGGKVGIADWLFLSNGGVQLTGLGQDTTENASAFALKKLFRQLSDRKYRK